MIFLWSLKGIGRALVQRLSSYGANVIALSRTEGTLATLKEECPSVKVICVDLTDWAGTKEVLSDIKSIDALINNAGIGGMQPFMEITPEIFDE